MDSSGRLCHSRARSKTLSVLDISCGHPLGVHRDDFLFQPGDVFLPLLDHLRVKSRFAVPRHIQIDLAELGLDGLGRVTISDVVGSLRFLIVLLESQVIG
jgi:hypothetical protein